jgi:hypothetical protein
MGFWGFAKKKLIQHEQNERRKEAIEQQAYLERKGELRAEKEARFSRNEFDREPKERQPSYYGPGYLTETFGQRRRRKGR